MALDWLVAAGTIRAIDRERVRFIVRIRLLNGPMLLAPRIHGGKGPATAADPSELLACGSLGAVRIMISHLTPKNEGRQVNEEAPERSSLGLPLLGSLSAWRRRTKQKRLPADMSASILKAVRFRTDK
jgi:hypothetical protein